MNMSDDSRFIYVPGSTLASRKIIEQSSYTTTPDQSSADPTPACGEAVYKTSLNTEKMQTVNLILEMEQTSGAKVFQPHNEEEPMDDRKEERTSKKAIDRAGLKKGKRINKDKSHVPKLSIKITLQQVPS